MCWTNTTTYITCAHRRTAKHRCQNYLSKPKKQCENFHYNDIVLDLCPKCFRTPSQPAPAPPPVFSQRLRTESLQSGEANSSAGQDSNGSELSVREKAANGLRKMLGSLRRNRGRSDNDNQSDAGSSQTLVAAPMETEGSVRSSERLAEEYRGIIGPQFRSACRQIEETVVPKGGDIETCTTWSRFLPRQDTSVQEAGKEAEGLRGKESQNLPGDMIPGLDGSPRRTEVVVRGIPGDEIPLDQVRAEELRKADERIARVRDGRGAMNSSGWI
jgi:hypothetical protein